MEQAKPEPKTMAVECSVCGLPWGAHGKDPTLETCIRLLRAELASARHPRFFPPFTDPLPRWDHTPPYRPAPSPFPHYPDPLPVRD